MVKIRETVTLPNEHVGVVWEVYEYGYLAQDIFTEHMEIVYTCASPIAPKMKHKCTNKLNSTEVCEYLDRFASENIEVVNITESFGGFIIFYKEETNESKMNRLGKKIESIFN